ncbi:MAG: M23 family metallopeptidase [Acidobacteriota bacterium]|nr:M23 family metallopeptidase [Acidobacteriota bacterium]
MGKIDRLAAEARLLDARREKLALERHDLETQIARTRSEEERERRRLEASRRLFRSTALLLRRIGPLGQLRPLLDVPDAERLAAVLRLGRELSRRRQEQVREIQQALVRLAELVERRQRQQAELARLERQAAAARRRLAGAIATRKELIAAIRRDTERRRQALAELHRAREELSAVLAGLTSSREIRLDIHAFRGLLDRPVKGRVTAAFGDRRDPRFGTVIPHPGWDIDADFGRRVRAPFEGRVAFADWFRGYGLVVVLDHGRGVHTVYAHLSAVLVEVGDRLDKGDVLGRVGDTGSLRGPYLYLEIREAGRAVDPAGWFRGES